jgi:hypothetical protein
MTIKLEKKTFVDDFLVTTTKLLKKVSLVAENDIIYFLGTSTNSMILYGEHKMVEPTTGFKFNIGDTVKFLNALKSISYTKEDNTFDLDVAPDCIKYKDDHIKFKYHSLADIAMPKIGTKKEKIEALTGDAEAKITTDCIKDILKRMGLVDTATKIYFIFTKDKLEVELTDKESPLSDSFSLTVPGNVTITNPSFKMEGNLFIFDLEFLQILSTIKCDYMTFKFVENPKLLKIEINNLKNKYTFIVSALVK